MLSFDIEEWFQSPDLKAHVRKSDWDLEPLRVSDNVHRLLDILNGRGVRATFFILGWVAERVPTLVSEIHSQGHEIASHGYSHDAIYDLSEEAFRKDVRRSKQVLEALTKQPVIGYRAPRFSITERAISILHEEGFRYDSSFFPSDFHSQYGSLRRVTDEHKITDLGDHFYEIPIPTLSILGRRLPWGGAGYFRVCPYYIFRAGVRKILKRYEGFVFYFHPWEIDVQQPRLNDLGLSFRLRHYWGLSRAEKKLGKLVRDFDCCSIRDVLDNTEML
jgi:polysaccharide deacetylase family protein (PEP-CTERM system associated)